MGEVNLTRLTIVGIYFIGMFAIGYYASLRIKTLKDYFVGGKKFNFWIAALSARATGESAWLLLGLTGMGAMVGMKAMWVVVGEVLGVAIAWIFMSRRFKLLTDRYDSVTIPDYLEARFKDTTHVIRIVASIALLIFPAIYISAQLDATGKAFDSFLGIPYEIGMIAGFAIVLIYVYMGGFVSVAWSDLIQGALMFFGLVFLGAYGVYYVQSSGGLMSNLQSLETSAGELTSMWGSQGFELMNLMGILSLFLIGLGYLGSPQIFVRYISIKSPEELKKGTYVAILWTLLADTGAVLAGMAGRIVFEAKNLPIEQLGNGGEKVLPFMTTELFPEILAAVFIAVVLAAIMSTVDSLLILSSSAFARDIYQKVLHPEISDEEMTSLCRKVTVVVSLLAFGLAFAVATLHPSRTIFWFVIFGWSGIAATFCPVLLISLFWKGLTKAGVIAGMVSGFFGVIIFKFGPGQFENSTFWQIIGKTEELAPAFLLSVVAAVAFSLFSEAPDNAVEDLEAAGQ